MQDSFTDYLAPIEMFSDRKIIKVSNDFALSSMNISEVSLNIFFALLSEITMEDEMLPSFDVPIKEIELKIGKKLNRDRKKLDRIKGELEGDNIILNHSQTRIPLCKRCEIVNESNVLYLQIEINPVLSNELLELESKFTQIRLDHFTSIKGFYAKKLYLFLKARKNMDHIRVNLDTLYVILNIPKSYEIYSNFKKRVLLQALSQIRKLTDDLGDIHYNGDKRGSRAVKQLVFVIGTIKVSSTRSSNNHKKKNTDEMDVWKDFPDDDLSNDTELRYILPRKFM